MRIVFMGTPEFSRTILERLIADGHALCGVFTQPDKPRNRGRVTPSPVKECAIEHGIPVFQPVKMRDGTALADLQALQPELVVVAAYGRILPKEMLDVPPLGCINVHASLLPKYRGAAPINWAILNGEQETGVTIMHMAETCDTGDMILRKKMPVPPEMNAEELFLELAKLGSDAISEAIEQIKNGKPHAAGSRKCDLRAHALTRPVPNRLEQDKHADPRSDPRSDPMALRRDAAWGQNRQSLPRRNGRYHE